MSFYRIDADYAVDADAIEDTEPLTGERPTRIQVATADSFIELLLTRESFERVLEAFASLIEESTIKPTADIQDGAVSIDKAPPGADESYKVSITRQSLSVDFLASTGETEGIYNLLREVHPDYEADSRRDIESNVTESEA